MTNHEHIIDGFAAGCFVLEWANAYDAEDCPHKHPWPSGARLEDYAPVVPAAVQEWAEGVCAEIERMNGAELLVGVFANNVSLPEHTRPPNPYDFGMCLAMEYLGTGVAWRDSHPHHGLTLPYGEFYVELDADNPQRLYIHALGLNLDVVVDEK